MAGEPVELQPVTTVPPATDLVEATEAALQAAYAAGRLTALDQAAVQALRDLAVKISAQDDYFDALYEQAAERGSRPPVQDNVSIPTYLKYCESLGLTPAARARQDTAKPAAAGAAVTAGKGAERGKSKVTVLRERTGAAG